MMQGINPFEMEIEVTRNKGEHRSSHNSRRNGLTGRADPMYFSPREELS